MKIVVLEEVYIFVSHKIMDAMFKSPFELISKSFDISKKRYAEKEIPPGQTAVGEITANLIGEI
jgi:uncharacterized membrane protein